MRSSTPVAETARPLSVPSRPESTDGRRIGVLVSHGFTGSPASMRPWAQALAERGYAVEMPRLPGHGTQWRELNKTGWEDWYGEITRVFDRLRDDTELVFVAGLSMGGGLALRLAADRPEEVAGLVLVNPAINTVRKDVLALPVIKHLVGSFPGIADDIRREDVTEHGYTRTPLRAAHSMMRAWRGVRADLPRVQAPLLLLRSEVDHVVDPSSAALILAGVSSPDVEEVVLTNSYHVATLDHDADLIVASSLGFIERLSRG